MSLLGSELAIGVAVCYQIKMALCPDAPPARESGLKEFNGTTSRSTLNDPRKTIGVPGSDQTPLSTTA
jgi:hypothetical protein